MDWGRPMLQWYVSTSRRKMENRPIDVIWDAEDFESEEAARAYASAILAEGVRVEAGTLPGVWPTVRVSWREAIAWVGDQ